MSEVEFSLVGSMLNLGAASVCVLTGFMINYFGRRGTMILVLIPYILGWCLLITAVNITMLIIGRALIGMACGACCVSCPVCIFSLLNFWNYKYIVTFGVRFMLAKLLIKKFVENWAHFFSY